MQVEGGETCLRLDRHGVPSTAPMPDPTAQQVLFQDRMGTVVVVGIEGDRVVR